MVAVWYGGEQLEVDNSTKIGFSYKSGICEADGATERSRTFNFTVPETPKNNRIFTYSEDPQYPGERQGVLGVIVDGGVWLHGSMYMTEWSGRRYSLLFIYDRTSSFDAAGMGGLFPDRIEIDDKVLPVEGGTIPNYSFYEYLNGAHQVGGPVGVPLTLFPTANLGYIIDTLASNDGYTVTYASGDTAHHYGLVMPQMREWETHTVETQAAGGAVGGFTTIVDYGGGTLADAGLMMGYRTMERGWPSANTVLVQCFTAIRHIKVRIVQDFGIYAYVTNNGYDCWNGEGTPKPTPIGQGHVIASGREFELDTGDFFTIVKISTDARQGDRMWWWGPLHSPPGYTGSVYTRFETMGENDVVGNGSTLNLADNFPEDLTLKKCLQAFCDIIAGFYDVDEVNKVITVSDFAGLMANATVGVDLDGMRILKVENVRRYIDGWAQHNRVRCKSADYVTDDCRFVRDYQCGNAWLEDERDWTEIPFNEGNWTMKNVGGTFYKCAQLDDVEVGSNGEYNHKGELTIIREAPAGVPAIHLQTTTDEGYGRQFGDFTLRTTTLVVTVRMPLFRFLQIRRGTLAHWMAREYLIREAAWDQNAAKLTLLSVEP